jgi:hypothetical protein
MEGQCMITMEVVRYASHAKVKPKFVNGSEDHRRFIFSRTVNLTLENSAFDPGETYYAPGMKEKGSVIGIETEFERVEWEGLKVKFIEVYFSRANVSHLYHPSELSRKKK